MSSLPLPPARAASLSLHVSAHGSSRVLSAAFLDSTSHRLALGHFLEPIGGAISSSAVSPLKAMIRAYAPTLRAADGHVLVFVDEKRLPSSERGRFNIDMSDLEATELQGVLVETCLVKHLASAAQGAQEARAQLTKLLKGGLVHGPNFSLLETHTPSPANAHADMSLACMEFLLRVHQLTLPDQQQQQQLGQWQISAMMLGVGVKSESASGDATAMDVEQSQEPLFMKLDPPAQAALNLFPQATDSDKNANLWGLLNKGRTPMSGRRLESWIKQPLTDLDEIKRRQDYVELLANDADLRAQLFDNHFKKVSDLDILLKKLQDNTKSRPASMSIQILVAMYGVLDRAPGILMALQSHQGPHAAKLQAEFCRPLEIEVIRDSDLWKQMMHQTVDMEAASRHDYKVLTSVSAELKDAWAKVEAAEEEMEELAVTAARELGLEPSKVKKIDSPMHGWVMRVSRKDEKGLRDARGYKSLETRKDGVYFTTQRMREIGVELKQARAEFNIVQQVTVDKALEITSTYTDIFVHLNNLLTEMDCFLALAHVAVNAPIPYVRPIMEPMGGRMLQMEDARHPCIEALSNASNFIPNDVSLVKSESNVQIITGPNMGGKSTYIRQAGVICVMAQIGSFVPCASARLSVVDSVLARVGAGDMAQKGVSTFMAEMLEAASIIKSATPQSLVIIDELGRGTSTYDGFGLAWAITEDLVRLDCFTFFATHFAELTELAQKFPCVKNMHVSAHTDANTITMMFKVQPGVSDRSFGVHVADVASFPPVVVEMARAKARELEAFGDEGINTLTAERAPRNGADSSPPSSQPSAGVQTQLPASKRVQAKEEGENGQDEQVEAPAWITALLTQQPASAFVDRTGTVNQSALALFTREVQLAEGGADGGKTEPQIKLKEEATPMETA